MEPLTAVQFLLILAAFGSGLMAIGYVVILPFLAYFFLSQPNVRANISLAWGFGGLCFFAGIFLACVTTLAPRSHFVEMFSITMLYTSSITLTAFGAWLIWTYARESLASWIKKPLGE